MKFEKYVHEAHLSPLNPNEQLQNPLGKQTPSL